MPRPLTADSILRHLKHQAATLFVLMALLWGAEVLDVVLRAISDLRLDAWGIRPRTISGLKGIVLAPFLHVDFNHLAANSFPLLVLASLVLLEGPRRFWKATGLIALLSGAAVWCIGQSNSVYLGASGIIFGYLGFVFMRAWVSRQPVWIAIAVASALVYGGLAMSLLSVQQGVSWLGHTSGLLSGMLTATLLHDGRGGATRPGHPEAADDEEHGEPDGVEPGFGAMLEHGEVWLLRADPTGVGLPGQVGSRR